MNIIGRLIGLKDPEPVNVKLPKRELIEVSSRIRVENGPRRKTGIAAPGLLDNRSTAGHYQIGRRDAMGKIIELGQPMTYLDYYGPWVWYIYRLEGDRWMPAGERETKDEALKAAKKE